MLQGGGADLQPLDPLGELGAPMPCPREVGAGTLGGGAPRAQLAPNLGDGAGGRRRWRGIEERQHALASGGELLLIELEVGELGLEILDAAANGGQLVVVAGGVGLQAGDHVGVEQLATVALERPAAFGDHRAETTCPLAQLLDLHQPVAEVVVAACAELGAGSQDVGVQRGELRLQPAPRRRRCRA